TSAQRAAAHRKAGGESATTRGSRSRESFPGSPQGAVGPAPNCLKLRPANRRSQRVDGWDSFLRTSVYWLPEPKESSDKENNDNCADQPNDAVHEVLPASN